MKFYLGVFSMDGLFFNLFVIILLLCAIILILFLKRDLNRLSDAIINKEKIGELPELQHEDDAKKVSIDSVKNDKVKEYTTDPVGEDVYSHDYDDIFADTCRNNNSGKYFIIISHENDEKAKMIMPDGNIKLLEIKLFNSFENKDLVEIFDENLITKQQLLSYTNYIEIDADKYIEDYERREGTIEQLGNEPEYIRSYRNMLKNPNTFPSRMLECICDNLEITLCKLKEILNEKYGYRTDTSGSFSASLRVLLVDGYVNIKGIGDNKTIILKKK